jgi:hypothetical protein
MKVERMEVVTGRQFYDDESVQEPVLGQAVEQVSRWG